MSRNKDIIVNEKYVEKGSIMNIVRVFLVILNFWAENMDFDYFGKIEEGQKEGVNCNQ